MLGRLGYAPNVLGRMFLGDVIISLEGFNDGIIHDYNILRHQMWASLAAFGGRRTPTPQKILPLPIDVNSDEKPVSKEEFLKLAAKMTALDKKRIAKA